jgi:hypothetical protein
LSGAKIGEARKYFFFEKKKQKTFIPMVYAAATTTCVVTNKSFLVLFFKKELLPLVVPRAPKQQPRSALVACMRMCRRKNKRAQVRKAEPQRQFPPDRTRAPEAAASNNLHAANVVGVRGMQKSLQGMKCRLRRLAV